MTPYSQELPRVRFPHTMAEDESIPGAISEATRGHWLLDTWCVLEAAAVEIRHMGLAQLASPEELGRIAHVIRCDGAALAAHAGVRDARNRAVTLFGDLAIPRPLLDLKRRRISPLSLRRAGHHRLCWLNLVLPYCPESLERLVDTCANCGSALGWRFSMGVANCEVCGRPVPPSAEAPLPEEIVDDYRLLAHLSTPGPVGGPAPKARLAAPIASVAPATAVRLALHLGSLTQTPMNSMFSSVGMATVPGPALARAGAAGIAMLRDWPRSLQDWVATEADRTADDKKASDALLARLRRMADPKQESADLAFLITSALPDLERHSAHRFAKGRHYLYKEVNARLGFKAVQARRFATWDGLIASKVPGNGAVSVRYDADQIDELEQIFRGTIPLNAVANRMGLPVYAVEQLCLSGLLEWEDHAAILLMRDWRDVRLKSFNSLLTRIGHAMPAAEPAPDACRVEKAVARIGGREKPWADVVTAILSGALPVWGGTGEGIAGIYVLPTDLRAFDGTVFRASTLNGFPRSDTMSQRDAAEILNVSPKTIGEQADQLGLTFVRKGKSMVVSKRAVLACAASRVWHAELAAILDIAIPHVPATLARRGFPGTELGWSRETLIAAGVLPTPQAS